MAAITNQILKMAGADLLRDLDLSDDELLYLLDLAADVKRSPRDYAGALAGKHRPAVRKTVPAHAPHLRTRRTPTGRRFRLLPKAPSAAASPSKTSRATSTAGSTPSWPASSCKPPSTTSRAGPPSPSSTRSATCTTPARRWPTCSPSGSSSAASRASKLAFVGDGNNVAHSLMLTATRLGVEFAIATPSGFEPNPEIVAQAEGLAATAGCGVLVTNDPCEALAGAHAVYTDVWTSMGQESEAGRRRNAFAALPGERGAVRARAPGRRLHALPPRATRRGGHRRRHRVPALGGLRPGRKPPARAKGAAPDDVRIETPNICKNRRKWPSPIRAGWIPLSSFRG